MYGIKYQNYFCKITHPNDVITAVSGQVPVNSSGVTLICIYRTETCIHITLTLCCAVSAATCTIMR